MARIAFDLSSTRGRRTGIGIYTDNLVRALRRFTEVEVVPLGDGATADQRTDRRIWREQFGIPRLTRRARAGLLHLTGFAAPFRSPCPVVLNAHDLIGVLFAGTFPPAARLYWSRYLPFTLRFAARLIVLSEHTKNDVVRLAGIPPARVRVIPPGCDEIFRPIGEGQALEQERARLALPARFLLFVSTLEPRKGVDTLIAAFARAAGVIPEDLVIVGRRGWYWEKFLAQVRQAGVEDRVRFVDYVQAEDLPLIYNLARAFVFPSRYEGFGLPPLEAMACGTPVICSNAASLPEVVGGAGLLVAPDDAPGLAHALVQVTQNDVLRADLRTRGFAQAQKFSWERAARETAQVYREVLDASHV